MDSQQLDAAFRIMNGLLVRSEAPPVHLVVCGGAALIAAGLIARTTRDVDIVALLEDGRLASPSPLPPHLLLAAEQTAEALQLPKDWINNAPSRNKGGLFQMGLPEGLQERLLPRNYGACLTAHFIGRLDQIHFKLYAAVERGGYHTADLLALGPTDTELAQAAQWALGQDVSREFRQLLRQLLETLGNDGIAATI
ncbi:MAG: hypothetical protein GXY15_08465 [Candidatus Hydrogenedentes bacterium]|nr:hypothetical protein [Candidatus Hydrogenedentota bacterium]